jgi:peptide/nickel transport system substrate-binding protein
MNKKPAPGDFSRWKNLNKKPGGNCLSSIQDKVKKFFSFFRNMKKNQMIILLVVIFSLFALGVSYYFSHTQIEPAVGGTFREGLIGQPRFINPLYLSDNDVDRDLVELLFSGITKHNSQGEIVNDLAERIEIEEKGTVYRVFLKENIFWHDGEPITSDDIIFTINLIQNPEYKSSQAIKWTGVFVEKISDTIVQFRLQKPYAGFQATLTEKIIPEHIFKDIPSKNLPWALSSKDYIEEYLVGSGPFKFKSLSQNSSSGYIESITLERNKDYFGQKPYLSEISFYFFEDESELKEASLQGNIDGLLVSGCEEFCDLPSNNFNLLSLQLPRYFAVFFNQEPPEEKSDILTTENIRKALIAAVDKEEILSLAIINKGEIVNSPILPDYYGFNSPETLASFNKEEAIALLEESGFEHIDDSGIRKKVISQTSDYTFTRDLQNGSQGEEVTKLQECLANEELVGSDIYPGGRVTGYFGNETKEGVINFQEKYQEDVLAPFGLSEGTGQVKGKTREKLNEICFPQQEEYTSLSFTLVTTDKPLFTNIAQVLKEEWQEIGVELIIEKVSVSQLETEIIKPRNYEAMLFGEVLGSIPDPFPFWHSSQKESPGLNIACYENETADELLETARETSDNNLRQENLESFQEILLEDAPALFLVRPNLSYYFAKKIKNQTIEKITEPAKRFSDIENWYIRTKRVWQ